MEIEEYVKVEEIELCVAEFELAYLGLLRAIICLIISLRNSHKNSGL